LDGVVIFFRPNQGAGQIRRAELRVSQLRSHSIERCDNEAPRLLDHIVFRSGFIDRAGPAPEIPQPWTEREIEHGTRFPGANAKPWFSIMSPQFAATHKLPVATRRIARNSVTCAKTNHRQREEITKTLRNAQRRLRRGARASTRYQQRMPVSQAAATGCSSSFHREDYRMLPLVLHWDKLSLYNAALGLRRPLHRCESARFRTARATGTD
jgi:hypothetical protein